MSSIKNEKIVAALNEYNIALQHLKRNNSKAARVHLVRALRLLEEAYKSSTGIDRIMAIRLFEKVSDVLNNLEMD